MPFLKSDSYYKERPISLMSILPSEEILPALREAGIEEVAFNLEVSDDELARKLMPGVVVFALWYITPMHYRPRLRHQTL